MAADLILFAVRFLLMWECERARKRGGTGPLAGLMAAGGSWSVIFGLGCYGCVVSGDMALAVLAALNVAGVVGVVSSRNAATPRYAIFVMLAVSLPFLVGALLSPAPGMAIVGFQVPFYVAGVIIVLLQNHAINARMIHAELDNRDLAIKDALTGHQTASSFRRNCAACAASLRRRQQTAAGRLPFSAWTSTASNTSMTASATRSATCCCARWPND